MNFTENSRDQFRNTRRTLPVCIIVVPVLVLCCFVQPSQAVDSATTRYFSELRRRHLFSLAEAYCLRQLAREPIRPHLQADLTLELSRTFAEHAKYTAGEEQAELWQRATQVIDDLLASAPRIPRRYLLQAQRVLVVAGKGEFLYGRLELFPYNEKLKADAKAALEQSVAQLAGLKTALETSLTNSRKTSTPKVNELTPYELRVLLYHVRFQRAAATLNLVKLFPVDSPDRAGLLIDAEEELRKLAGGPKAAATTVNSQILLAEAKRIRGDFKQAIAILNSVAKKKPSRDIMDRVVAQQVRVMLSSGNATNAAKRLVEYRDDRDLLPEKLSFLKVKTSIALWEIANREQNRDLADRLMQQIELQVDRADREVGGYWAYRSRLLLKLTKETEQYGSEIAAVVQKARFHFGKGQFDEAIREYAAAEEIARRENQPALSMELGYTRASIELQSGRYDQASHSFLALVNRFPTSKRAANAHLLAAYCLGKSYEKQKTDTLKNAYAKMLRTHRDEFKNHPTTVEATWMLANFEEHNQQITRALNLYLEIPAEHKHGPQAQVAVARCYDVILERLRGLGQPLAKWESEALKRLDNYVSDFPMGKEPLKPYQYEVMLRLARIELNRDRPDYVKADRLLQQIISVNFEVTSPDKSEKTPDNAAQKALARTATQLRVISLAGQNRRRDAQLLLEGISQSSPAEALSILDGLTSLVAKADAETRYDLGELQLAVAVDLDRRRSNLTDREDRRLDHCLAQAYAATKLTKQAIEVYEKLLFKSPRDRDLLRVIADLFVECGTFDCLAKATKTWRRMESLEKPGSIDWLEARYQAARCLFLAKEYVKCQKLVGVTKLLYPDLGNIKLQREFRRLQDKLNVKLPKQ